MAKQELLIFPWIFLGVCDGGRNLYNKTKCTVVLQIITVPCLQLKLKILRVLLIYTPVYSSHVPVGAPRVVNCVLSMTRFMLKYLTLYFSRS